MDTRCGMKFIEIPNYKEVKTKTNFQTLNDYDSFSNTRPISRAQWDKIKNKLINNNKLTGRDNQNDKIDDWMKRKFYIDDEPQHVQSTMSAEDKQKELNKLLKLTKHTGIITVDTEETLRD